ncbi:hypothetical protein WICMUC_002791 [Wickerhamomyces mucosus]|uniref:Nucleolar protein 12 n=1 Tax=Wickerhamomyces mucosus TaxID=1378264 RepID=A0A9P8PP98_9ASCO|nr:hypothetical protein WICMUC_002791 [Wickerhamomyces mucosus]
MVAINDLFGNAKKDDTVSGLFSSSSGPVKRTVRERTVIERAPEPESESESGPGSGTEPSGDEEVEDAEPEPKSFRNRTKANDENDDLESKYLEKLIDNGAEDENEEESEDSTDDEDEQKEEKTNSVGAKSINLKEAEIEKAERTIFVGNLNSKVITSKKDYKEFKGFFLKFGTIESIRFRSIAFNEALPRKVAFVKQKLHESRDSVNSYIVFKTKESVSKSLKSNGEILFDLHIRVDSISHPSKIDNSRAIFVGNLDFEEKEEELWKIFNSCGEIENVRIVRDSKTNVGKGFGYVQFKDFTAVSKALLLNEKKLGEKKRKLRITRSKKMKPKTDDSKKPNKFNNNHNNNGPKVKKPRHKSLNLTDDQKTKLGRAKRVLGKADRSTAGGEIVEGMRAKKGDHAAGIKNGKNRVKKPRIRQRSTDFKNARNSK